MNLQIFPKWAVMILLLGMFLTSCKHDPFPYDGPIGEIPTKKCDPDSVYFNRDILPLLQANCAVSGCHDAATGQNGVILTDYQNIVNTADVRPGKPDNSDLYEVISETRPDKRMPPPPASPLAASDIEKVRIWILQGALNNSCTDCDTTNVRYSVEIENILQTYCRSCHSGPSAPNGMVFNQHQNAVEAVQNKNLLERIEHISGYSAMPPGGPMPDCELKTFKTWIGNGMPNN